MSLGPYSNLHETVSVEQPSQGVHRTTHTLFADPEQLVSLPGHDSAWQSTPAPLQHAAEHLQRYQLRLWPVSG